jgi:predicted  nucleic acid-binding Zn-ribbon protein
MEEIEKLKNRIKELESEMVTVRKTSTCQTEYTKDLNNMILKQQMHIDELNGIIDRYTVQILKLKSKILML